MGSSDLLTHVTIAAVGSNHPVRRKTVGRVVDEMLRVGVLIALDDKGAVRQHPVDLRGRAMHWPLVARSLESKREFLAQLMLESFDDSNMAFEPSFGRWVVRRLADDQPFTDQHIWRDLLASGSGSVGLAQVQTMCVQIHRWGLTDLEGRRWSVDRVMIDVPLRTQRTKSGKLLEKRALWRAYRRPEDAKRLSDLVSRVLTDDPTARKRQRMPWLHLNPTDTEAATAATDVGKHAPSDAAPSDSPSMSGPLKKDTIL